MISPTCARLAATLALLALAGCGVTKPLSPLDRRDGGHLGQASDAGSMGSDAGTDAGPTMDGGVDAGAPDSGADGDLIRPFCTDEGWCWEYPTQLLGQPTAMWEATSIPVAAPGSMWGAASDDVWIVGYLAKAFLHWDGATWTPVSVDIHSPDWFWPHAIWGFATNDIWTCGDHGGTYHWDGWTWRRMPTPASSTLWRMWGASPSNLWAVGDMGTIVHWDGQSWTVVASGTTENLYAIWGITPTDLWAVGDQGMILHGDGTKWTQVPSGTTAPLRDVWGDTKDDAYAAGDGLYRWNGQRWTKLSGSSWCERLWGGGHDVWCAGQTVQRWDGTTLRSFSLSPYFIPDANWQDIRIWGSDPDHVWLVGWNGLVLRWNGRTLETIHGPKIDDQLPTDSDLWLAWGLSKDDFWVVGYDGPIHWDGARWQRSMRRFPAWHAIGQIVANSRDDVWAFGDGRYDAWRLVDQHTPSHPSVMHFDGKRWQPLDLPSGAWPGGGWADGPSDLWVTTASGFAHWDGASWTEVNSGPPNGATVFQVMGNEPHRIYALDGDNGVLHWDGHYWNYMTTTPVLPKTIFRVWGFSGSDIWVLSGHGQTAWGVCPNPVHWDGVRWAEFPAPCNSPYQMTPWASGVDSIWLVDPIAHDTLHWNGVNWSNGTWPSDFTAFWGTNSMDVWGVAGREVRHWNGVNWTTFTTPNLTPLVTISEDRSGGIWVGGGDWPWWPLILSRRN